MSYSNARKSMTTIKKKSITGLVNKLIGFCWIFTGIIIFLMFFGVFAISQGWLGELPPVSDLQNPINKYASRIYSADNKVIGTWSYTKDNRVMVPYDSLPDNLIKALVATEDVRFHDHSGIDAKAIVRAIVKRQILGQKNAGGGSTITQQLAKQLYTKVERSESKRMMQKPIEWFIAVQLERYYTKEEILTMYLNYFDFLYTGVGIKNAARTYFGKNTFELDLNECATLVGMCKNPSLYNPYKRQDGQYTPNETCRQRRNVVLSQMEKAGFITAQTKDSVQQEPLAILPRPRITTHKEGVAPYFREYLRRIMMAKKPERNNYASWQGQQYHDDSIAWETDPLYGWCNKNKKKNGAHYNIYTDGLKIHTSIDSRMQKMAEDAMFEHVAKYLQPAFEREIKNSPTGPYRDMTVSKMENIINRYIRQSERYRAMKAGGHSHEEIMAAFDIPVDMKVFQYGSTYDTPQEVDVRMSPKDSIIYYKKFLRAAACAIDPENGQVKAYVPGLNFEYFMYDNVLGGGHRQVGSTIKPLLYALAMSSQNLTPCDEVNANPQDYGGWTPKGDSLGMVPLKLALAQSNNHASAYLLSLIKPETFIDFLGNKLKMSTYTMEPNLTLALGSCDVSVGEMASAYTIFPSYGVHYQPLLVTHIENSEGDIVASFTPRMNEVLSKEKAYQMIDVLRAVINEGTGRALRGSNYNIRADMGGKTGTTNSHADGWFIGFSPKLVVACWVGGEDRDIHFGSMAFGQGARAALPIYGKLMRKIYDNGKLGIAEKDTFDIPANYSPCDDGLQALPDAEDILYPEDENLLEADDAFF